MKRTFAILTALLLALAANAQPFISLPSLISDGMVLQADSMVRLWGWADPNVTISIETSWGEKAEVKTGFSTFFSVSLKTPQATFEPQSISFCNNRGGETLTKTVSGILIGQVWLCAGQSNMALAAKNGVIDMNEDIASGNINGKIRLFTAPKHCSLTPQEDVQGHWEVCDTSSVKWFSSVGYYFGNRLQEVLDQPVGLINVSWGGTPVELWVRPEALNQETVEGWKKLPVAVRDGWDVGTGYNGMIAPVVNMVVSGAIWYQGEANRHNASNYAYSFSKMIQYWREQFQQDLPFYFVQIAPKEYKDNDLRGAIVREQQEEVAKTVENTGIVAIYDVVEDVKDIHPKYKKPVGERLAGQALTDVYGKDMGKVRHAAFASMEIVKNKIIVSFTGAEGGLVCPDKEIIGLEVGDGTALYPAQGKIQGDKLVVWSKEVKDPVCVRYCFSQAIGNLFDIAGLPVLPFRSDKR